MFSTEGVEKVYKYPDLSSLLCSKPLWLLLSKTAVYHELTKKSRKFLKLFESHTYYSSDIRLSKTVRFYESSESH